jgi:hypothetical protein
VRADLRQSPLAEVGEAVVQRPGDRQLEHRVAEDLEAFVGGGAVGGPRRMREDRRLPLGRERVDQLPECPVPDGVARRTAPEPEATGAT